MHSDWQRACQLKRTEGKKIKNFYLHFRPCTIMFSTFFLAYPSFFHLKKVFYYDFGPSALRLRMESAVIFAAYDVHMGKTCEKAP